MYHEHYQQPFPFIKATIIHKDKTGSFFTKARPIPPIRAIFIVCQNMSAGSSHLRADSDRSFKSHQCLCWLWVTLITPCIPCSNSNSHLLPTTNIKTDQSGMLQLHSLQPGAYQRLLMCWALRDDTQTFMKRDQPHGFFTNYSSASF